MSRPTNSKSLCKRLAGHLLVAGAAGSERESYRSSPASEDSCGFRGSWKLEASEERTLAA